MEYQQVLVYTVVPKPLPTASKGKGKTCSAKALIVKFWKRSESCESNASSWEQHLYDVGKGDEVVRLCGFYTALPPYIGILYKCGQIFKESG